MSWAPGAAQKAPALPDSTLEGSTFTWFTYWAFTKDPGLTRKLSTEKQGSKSLIADTNANPRLDQAYPVTHPRSRGRTDDRAARDPSLGSPVWGSALSLALNSPWG